MSWFDERSELISVKEEGRTYLITVWSSRDQPTLIKWMNIRLLSRGNMKDCTKGIQSSHSLDLLKWFLYSLCHAYWVALPWVTQSGRGASAPCSLFNTASGLWWYFSKLDWGRKDEYIWWGFAWKRGLEAKYSFQEWLKEWNYSRFSNRKKTQNRQLKRKSLQWNLKGLNNNRNHNFITRFPQSIPWARNDQVLGGKRVA